jgi:hypothetical protein
MGTAVIGGMLASTAIAIFVIPALFYVVEKLTGAGRAHAHTPVSTPGLQPSIPE